MWLGSRYLAQKMFLLGIDGIIYRSLVFLPNPCLMMFGHTVPDSRCTSLTQLYLWVSNTTLPELHSHAIKFNWLRRSWTIWHCHSHDSLNTHSSIPVVTSIYKQMGVMCYCVLCWFSAFQILALSEWPWHK